MADVSIQQGGYSIKAIPRWLPVVIGLIALYSHAFSYSWNVVWQDENYAYGPLIFAVSCWLLWDKRSQLVNDNPPPVGVAGLALLIFGLMLYILGRSQEIYIVEMGSLSPVLAGALVVMSGSQAFRSARFPLFFLLFMLPLPNPLVDVTTGPLKQWISIFAENILYFADYPIARSGVVLSIGQYQLLVADACSGLHSMFSLTALGILYMHMMGARQWWRNAILLACILPIAFFANVARVVVLVLVTFYFGDAAGQGFIHGFAGMVLFIVALFLLIVIDKGVEVLLRARHRA